MPQTPSEISGPAAFKAFLAPACTERVFLWPTGHPSGPTGFCPCDGSIVTQNWFYLKATLLLVALKLPYNSLKVFLLRKMGATVGRNVILSVDVWIDPTHPQLIAIEDNVLIGTGVRLFVHEFGPNRFKAGRIVIRKGAVIGGCAIIGPGVEIGENAVVAGAAAVGRDVPAGKMAVGNPARIMALTQNNLEIGGQ